ncbi:MAG: N-acetyltransferase [Microbacteriaceae bacterium]|nr:N-acetyltransferase [Microbacteriaceae bacterium]
MSHDALSPAQFGEYTLKPVFKGLVQATKGDEYVGHLRWEPYNDGKVQNIHVKDEHQRKGVATAMWDYAHQVAPEMRISGPVHSDFKTPEGQAWAESVESRTR